MREDGRMRSGAVAAKIGVLSAAIVCGCQSHPDLEGTVSRVEGVRIEKHGLAAEFHPSIDRVTFFGRTGGANLLQVSDLERVVPSDGSYVFWGGCYTWVAPQKSVEGFGMGWLDADGTTRRDWPPDPAMDVGPVRRVGGSADWMSFVGPDQRSGLREEKSLRILAYDEAEFAYTLRNRGIEPVTAGPWINTAVGAGDVIAVRMPSGVRIWGWNAESVERFRSITGEADARGWALVDLSRATWAGGIKVYLAPAEGSASAPVEIAVWRREARAWMHRSLGVMTDAEVARLQAAGEGPVAVYIQPGKEDAIIEAELYGPLTEIAPGSAVTSVERWRVIESPRADAALLP